MFGVDVRPTTIIAEVLLAYMLTSIVWHGCAVIFDAIKKMREDRREEQRQKRI